MFPDLHALEQDLWLRARGWRGEGPLKHGSRAPESRCVAVGKSFNLAGLTLLIYKGKGQGVALQGAFPQWNSVMR